MIDGHALRFVSDVLLFAREHGFELHTSGNGRVMVVTMDGKIKSYCPSVEDAADWLQKHIAER
jgi:hypothetical protein